MKNLSKDRQSPGQDLNLGTPEYKAGVITTQLQRLVQKIVISSHF
jgi:hypothetical protein